MSQWFRMYATVLNDPKVQRLPDPLFRSWVNILCLACEHDGSLPSVDDIAFALRTDSKKMLKVVEALLKAGLLDDSETGLKPHNWGSRQYKSDVSTDRVKRFRNAKRNVSPAVSETPPDTETEQSIPLSNDNGASIDSDKQFWDNAKSYLGASKASLIGKWVKEQGHEATAKAITAAQIERAVNPVEFIVGHFRAAAPREPVIGL